jgi:hypothetical protein
MPTIPTRTRLANSRAASPSRVKIAVLVLRRQRDGVIEVPGARNLQHRPEDLFLVGFHLRRHAVE